ncbi:MAG: tetratricopeptide repeat protein [Sphingobacteriaceae bacterium]|nr:tetratricopeptide repeat protein [Sphingobacteriaceae bacterium]
MKKRFLTTLLLVLCWLSKGIAYQDSLRLHFSKVKEASYLDSARFELAQNELFKFIELHHYPEDSLAEFFIYKGNFQFYKRKLEDAIHLYNKCLDIALKNKDEHFEILSKIRLFYVDREYGLTQNTIQDVEPLLKISIKNKDNENEFEIYNLLGIICEEKGDTKAAAEYYIKGLSKAELLNDVYFQANFLNNLGLVKFYLGESERASDDFERGIKVTSNTKYTRLLSYIKLNYCLVQVSLNNYSKVSKIFREVMDYNIRNNLPVELANSYAILGSAYIGNNEFEKGITYKDSAIYIFNKYNFKIEAANASLSKARFLLDKGLIKEVENAIAINEDLIMDSKNSTGIMQLYDLKYLLNNKKNNFREALNYYLLYTNFKDSVHKALNTRTLDELQVRYNVQKKEIQLEREQNKLLLLQKNYRHEVYLRWILSGVALLLIALIVTYFYLRYNRNMRIQQELFSKNLIINIENERSRIAQDLHDDIGQSLSILKSKITSDPSAKNKDIANKEIERVIEQTRQISRNLFPSYVAKVGLRTVITGLIESIQNTFNLECSFDFCPEVDKLSPKQSTHLFRIIQECLNNTIKHSQSTALKISFETQSDALVMTYQDNGNWDNANLKALNGIGILSIKEHAKIIDSTFSITKNDPKGFKLILKIK